MKEIKQKNVPAPVQQEARPLVSGSEFNRKIAAFRKTKGVVESCRINFICQVSEQHFESLFERDAPDELFKCVARTVLTPSASGLKILHTSGFRKFKAAEFDFRAFQCGCGRDDFVVCHCGQISCRPRLGGIFKNAMWVCKPGCGAAGLLLPLIEIAAATSTGSGWLSKVAQAQPANLCPPRRPLLPRGGP